ncbi:hypothetical protein DXG01_009033, partial [Tephrocybe rancida]
VPAVPPPPLRPMEKTLSPSCHHLVITANASGKDLVVISSPLHLRYATIAAPVKEHLANNFSYLSEPPVPTPAAPHPVLCKKSGAVSGAAPGADAEDEAFILPHALQKRIPDRATEGSDPPSPAQPCPPPVSPSRSASPDGDDSSDSNKTPPPLQPRHNETPVPPSLQPRQPPPLRLPSPSSPIVHDPGCTPSGSNFESMMAAEQLAISWMRPAKHPVSEESQDEEDEQAFKKDFQEQTAKGKKGKGKKSNVEGPFKSGPIPEQAKQRAFAIHASFEKQIQDLAAEIGKAPQLLFLLMGEGPLLLRRAPTRWGAFEAWYRVHGEMKKSKHTRTDFQLVSPQEWTKLVATERDKYCKANLGDKWEDPEALATLFEPIMAWYLEKHETYMEDLKLEGTFDKVIGKVQHEYMCLAETAFRYNGVHCFGFIVNLQPDHTGRTGSAMWGATPAFEQMMIDEKGVISQQIVEWETLLRRADMTLNGDAKEHEKELWTVPITGSRRDHARQAFLAWLGRDI